MVVNEVVAPILTVTVYVVGATHIILLQLHTNLVIVTTMLVVDAVAPLQSVRVDVTVRVIDFVDVVMASG